MILSMEFKIFLPPFIIYIKLYRNVIQSQVCWDINRIIHNNILIHLWLIIGPFGKSVELIEKMILSLNCKQDILRALPVLPILTDVLLRSSSRTDHILELIQDLSFGVIIKTCHPFVERLLKYCINVVCNEGDVS